MPARSRFQRLPGSLRLPGFQRPFRLPRRLRLLVPPLALASSPLHFPPGALLLPGTLLLPVAILIPGCRQILPVPTNAEEVALRTYRDTLLDLDIGYPEGWSFTEKKSVGNYAVTHDLLFEPQNTLYTRRFQIKVMIPHRLPEGRTLEEFKAEYLARLSAAGDDVRLADTGRAVLGGEPAFRARYAVAMGGKPFTRHTDYLCLREGRDVSLAFEVAEGHAEDDIGLYRRIAERFRFDTQ